ncbi:MAG: hypothetical protein AAGA77_18450, partial [Bacteroidota bacterium]
IFNLNQLPMKNILATLTYNQFYHIFNCTNNKEVLFRSNENKRYFLRLVKLRLAGYLRFYAYALLGNHFHFAVSVRSEEEIEAYIRTIPLNECRKSELDFLENSSCAREVHKLISIQLSRVFNSYSQAINKRYARRGHLFHTPYKRLHVNSKIRLTHLIYYIHHNSRKHGMVKDFLSDSWHSYHDILSDKESFLQHQFVLDLFGGEDGYVEFHFGKYLESDFRELSIE